MRTFTSILLGVSIFLLTLLVVSIIEYCLPGSVSWIPKEIDWWFYKVWSVAIFIVILLLAVAIVGWIFWKGIPALARLIQRHKAVILGVAAQVTSNPTGRKILVGIGLFIAFIFLLAIIIGVILLFC